MAVKWLDLPWPEKIQQRRVADVAQLVEPLVVVQVVAGSSPVVRPISNENPSIRAYCREPAHSKKQSVRGLLTIKGRL